MKESVFTNTAFLEMLVTILVWIVIYIIVSVINSKAGVGSNLLETAVRRIGSLRKACLEFRENFRIVSKTESFNERTALKDMKKVLLYHKRASKLLAVYLFDDKENRDVIEAKKLIDDIPVICRTAVSDALDGKSESEESFAGLETKLEGAVEKLEKARMIDKRNQLLKLQ